jgi:UDP-glucuronate 4-epimerase
MRDSKILITGPTGQVASPIAQALAADNEVWGIARFTNAAAREALEKSGVRCETVNLAAGDFTGIPSDFDYVLNLAVAKSGNWDKDLAANAESVGLLMAHCRNARAFLQCSSGAVYDPPDEEPRTERAALGDNHKPLFPTYSISKIAGEVVARTMARALGVPTVIARLNVPYGDNGGWPFYHMEMMLAGIPRGRHDRDHPETACGGVGSGDHAQLVRRAGREPPGVVRLPWFAGRQGTGLPGERAGVTR